MECSKIWNSLFSLSTHRLFLGATHFLPPQGDFLRAPTLIAKGGFLGRETHSRSGCAMAEIGTGAAPLFTTPGLFSWGHAASN